MQYELFGEADFLQETPFTGRSVCLLGNFSLPTRTLRQRLQAMGADIKQSVSRNLHYVAVGMDAPADALQQLSQLVYHGYCPRVLHENDLKCILDGLYAGYSVPEQIKKNLHLTLQHYLDGRLNLEGQQNPLYTKELYLAPDVPADFFQMLGNRGVYANTYIDDTTDVLVLSDATLLHLREEESDDTLRYIEQQYNRSRAQAFHYTLTSEGELLNWLKQ